MIGCPRANGARSQEDFEIGIVCEYNELDRWPWKVLWGYLEPGPRNEWRVAQFVLQPHARDLDHRPSMREKLLLQKLGAVDLRGPPVTLGTLQAGVELARLPVVSDAEDPPVAYTAAQLLQLVARCQEAVCGSGRGGKRARAPG